MANATGADFYYSIHSDAGPPGVNSTLMLWGADGSGRLKKFPRGRGEKKKNGRYYWTSTLPKVCASAEEVPGLTPSFYGATTRTTPYLAVNRLTNMGLGSQRGRISYQPYTANA